MIVEKMEDILDSIDHYLLGMRFVMNLDTRKKLYLQFQNLVVKQINETILDDKDISNE